MAHTNRPAHHIDSLWHKLKQRLHLVKISKSTHFKKINLQQLSNQDLDN